MSTAVNELLDATSWAWVRTTQTLDPTHKRKVDVR
jgi:hypothetical protein